MDTISDFIGKAVQESGIEQLVESSMVAVHDIATDTIAAIKSDIAYVSGESLVRLMPLSRRVSAGFVIINCSL